jgi:hypothetical protein
MASPLMTFTGKDSKATAIAHKQLQDLTENLAYLQEVKQEYEQCLKNKGGNKIIEVVKAIYSYQPVQSTELELKEGDIINGEKIRVNFIEISSVGKTR